MGVFQLEGSGMRSLMRVAATRSLSGSDGSHLAVPARTARCRHPLALGRSQEWQGSDRIPACRSESVLSETYGSMVYQEQVMQSAQVMAGFSLS